MIACEKEYLKVVKLLVNNDAQMELSSKDNWTPPQVVKFLLGKGTNVNTQNIVICLNISLYTIICTTTTTKNSDRNSTIMLPTASK